MPDAARPEIFVSFKHGIWTETVADELLRRLGSESIEYYRLQENRPIAGENFEITIDREIARSAGVIHILSPECYKSRFVKFEYRAALFYKKPRALLLLPRDDPPLDWPENRWRIVLTGVQPQIPGRAGQPVRFGPEFDSIVHQVDEWAKAAAAGRLDGAFYDVPPPPPDPDVTTVTGRFYGLSGESANVVNSSFNWPDSQL